MVNKRIEGSIVLVTGAGSGIGRATAHRFAREGASVLAVDLDEAAAEKVATECAERGPDAAGFRCDVSDWEAVSGLAHTVALDWGPPDVVVNNAGVGMAGRLLDVTIEDWHWIRSTNLDGVLHCCKAFGPAMVERGSGAVVNVSSGLAYTPRATEPAYVTTKAAVLALSQCLRADWGRHGVGVSVVCPGVIDTPIIRATRFLGPAAEAIQEQAEQLFSHGHPPALVAQAIVDAVRRDRAVVPVGWEARVGWYLHRFAPTAVTQWLARSELPWP